MVVNQEVTPEGGSGKSRRLEVEIISTGRELLIGKTVNTNAAWIASRVTGIGAAVNRVVMVGDSVREISGAIIEALGRKPGAVIITGGLGPTYDDMTVEALASALRVPTVLNEDALRMVSEKYSAMGLPMAPQRIKMAYLPVGAVPIRNEVGTAPGAAAEFRGTSIFCLPGVPREMKVMFDSSVLPALSKRSGAVYGERVLLLEKVPESTLASAIDEVRRMHPNVYFKSHPKGSEAVPVIEMHLSAYAPDSDALSRALDSAEGEFISAARQIGAQVRRGGA
ncbi:MAG: molybdopterin-binding protein [Candidatus Methanosuratincola sp.]|jgi:molybdenum cofactor synthesis domain-containing protein|nr:molybdopterin-binding protein [Candidatus Methanosuratincola sp.]